MEQSRVNDYRDSGVPSTAATSGTGRRRFWNSSANDHMQTTPAGPAPTTALNPKRLDSVLQRLENSENDTSRILILAVKIIAKLELHI